METPFRSVIRVRFRRESTASDLADLLNALVEKGDVPPEAQVLEERPGVVTLYLGRKPKRIKEGDVLEIIMANAD